METRRVREIERFATDRLAAERMSEKHFAELHRMWQDPRVMATLGGVRSEKVSRKKLGLALDHWARYGFGIWVLRRKESGEFVGHSGLRHMELDGRAEVDLGYSLRAEFSGQGLATEIAHVLLAVGFRKLGFDQITALALPTNLASRRVMEKVGLQYERDIVHQGLPHVLYRIRCDQYGHT